MKYVKKLLFIFFMVIGVVGIVSFGDNVSAVVQVDDPANTAICFNQSTGAFTGSYVGSNGSCGSTTTYGMDRVKLIGSQYAYCVQWKLAARSYNYYEDTTWNKGSASAIMAGYLINYVNGKYSSMPEQYEMTAATLNTFFSKYIGDSNSMNFYSTNSTIKGYYDQAISYYNNNVKLTNNLPAVNITTSDKVLTLSGSNYVSTKVTVSGFVATYGGTNDTVTYTITPTSSNGAEVKLCTNSRGTNCQTSITLSNQSSDYSFYVFVAKDKVSTDDTISLKVSGSNKSVYPSSIRYTNSNYANSQKLLTVTNYPVNRSISKTSQFTVPNLINHRIVGYKVDENGVSLNGATLELYKDDVSISSNLLKGNNGSGSSISYTSPTVAENDDDFFKHDYYLVEKSAPDGYVLSSSVNKFYLKDSTISSNSTACYYNGGNDSEESKKVDNEFCNFENYEYKCLSSTGEYLDLNESGNCEFNSTDLDDGVVDSDSDSSIYDGYNNDALGGEENSEEEKELEDGQIKEEVTYTKICYNKGKDTSADVSYCSDKGNYTKVVKSNGNLVVTQVNKKNSIKISKKDITGEKELAGATLKICTFDDYRSKGDSCDPAETIDNVEMNWVSSEKPYELVGIPKGDYYIVEEVPPKGYVKATTAVEFSIDETGKVKTGDTIITNEEFEKDTGVIVIKNGLNSIVISKQDMATSKELPGATISICRTYKDENGDIQLLVNQYTGECIEAIKADGTVASWVSTSEPTKIEGLAVGTYYLVEKIAPTDYTTAESILFTLKSDGTLVDKDGNSLADNKLIMYDNLITEVSTGSLSTYIVVAIFGVAVVSGVLSLYYLRKPKLVGNSTNRKLRGRRIHKKLKHNKD